MKEKVRIYEIDLLRGIGVIFMVLYHTVYDLNFFQMYNLDLNSILWVLVSKAAQIIFIVSAGITFTLSYERAIRLKKRKGLSAKIRHIMTLSGLALLITFITWGLFGEEQAVTFGILHFFAVATVITIPFYRFGTWNSTIGVLIMAAGIFMPKFDTSWWLYPIGLYSQTSLALDYFPLLPWFGVFLEGVAIGSLLVRFNILQRYKPMVRQLVLEKIGRRSLMMYLVHQPIIAGIILAYGYMKRFF